MSSEQSSADDAIALTVQDLLGDTVDGYSRRFQTFRESQESLALQLDLIQKRELNA